MTSLACLSAGRLIDQRRSGLDDAEQLRLEEHLTQCDDCSAHAAMLDGLRGLVDSEAPSMDGERRSAILDDALTASDSVRRREPSVLRRRGPVALATAALAAAAAVLIGLGQDEQPAAPAMVSAGDRVLDGAVQVDGAPLPALTALPAGRELSSERGAKLALGPARVELRAGSGVRWQPARHAVTLTQGSLLAEVDPAAKARFVVETPDFQVEVTGTRFWVTLGGVGVEHGSVRVLSADGRVLNAQLTAGSRWNLPVDEAVSTEAAREGQPLPEEADGNSGRSARRADVGDLLLRARASIAPGRTDEARKLLRRALSAGPTRSQRAEARTLQAECALVDGEGRKAARIYRDVADRFRALPAGENALFAAARIHATREQRSRATELLQRYEKRYPKGRFRQEVAARLKALQAPR